MKNLLVIALVIVVTASFVIKSPFKKLIKQQQYDINHSKSIAYLASVAYCPKSCLEKWTCKSTINVNMTDIAYIKGKATWANAYIGYESDKDQIIVSFRGSANIQNWIEDFTFDKVPYKHCSKCEIHQGFYEDYLVVAAQIKKQIEKLTTKYSKARIITTGHSMGGAMAMIGGLAIKLNFPTTFVEIHTFGGPRIGNSHLSKYINNKIDNIFRLVHNRDIVPHLPPDSIEFGYHHPAYEIFFNKAMTSFKTCDESGEDKSCSNQYVPDYTPVDHGFYLIDMDPQC